jgi:putative ABC transport system permease protein
VELAPAEAMRPEPPATFHAGLLERIGLRAFLTPAWRMIIRNLDRRRWRAVFAVLAVALAVAIIIAGRFAIDSVQRLVDVQFHAIQREDVTISFQESRPSRVRHEVAALPGVLRAESYRELPARLRFGHRARRVGVLGLASDAVLRRPLNQQLQPVPLPPDGLVLSARLAQDLNARPGNM